MTTTQILDDLIRAGAPATLNSLHARIIARQYGVRPLPEWNGTRRFGRLEIAQGIAESLRDN